MRRYEGSVVLITGAAGGFGSEAARRFAGEGARLLLSDIRDEPLEAVAAPLRAEGAEVETLAGDVSAWETADALVARAVERFGGLDVAVNNAGIGGGLGKLSQVPVEEAQRIFSINLMGVFLALKAQIPQMERQFAESGRRGAILNVASVAGVIGAPLLSVYSAAKHGVVGLTKSAAGECARKGIRINCLCPAFAETQMVTDFLDKMSGSAEEARARVLSNMPMRRFGQPDEVVQAMLWACAPENAFMTGHALVLDGGLSAV